MDTYEAELIELIYTAALIPETWPEVIDRMARRMNARGGSLFTLSDGQLTWDAPASTRPIMEAYIAGGWAEKNPRLDGLISRAHPGFIQDSDVANGEYDSLPIVQDFLRPHDIVYTAATVISGAKGDLAVFSVDRGMKAGYFTPTDIGWLDHLRPHLSRSVSLTSRLKMRVAANTTAALQMIGIPAAVIQRGKGLLATNALFDDLIDTVFITRALGRISLADRRADKALQQALSTTSSDNPIVRSIPVTSSEGVVGVLHTVPACRQAMDLLGSDATLLVLAQPRENAGAAPEFLRWLYDLTATEAVIASKLSIGLNVNQIAQETSTSENTVRTHVKAILRKTGFSRQTDFLVSISSLSALKNQL
ncbi:helix-turn-helix transcriptional regulator [Aureimonas sp. AU20]|uniref:helix-turn-helix transcriptional regulator n=1 Tax=Aureimonas sp. AU20 TaxID=1349819 RepID=UPI0007205BAA|nr:helix-turn-helix transcriptional regulator [Aureimonas sp. AU20]ALN75725.1 DNA-binding protein [Aureimonas sp. AU20]